MDAIYGGITAKIRNLILFWERVKLTLPGRITIMKTCLISQLNYIGCFLPAPEAALVQLQRLIDGFVKKNLPVAADRLYLPPELGGLGIFKLDTFLQAQHCSWVSRAAKLPIDNWRFDLRAAAPNRNILLIRPCDLNPSISISRTILPDPMKNPMVNSANSTVTIKRPTFSPIRPFLGGRTRICYWIIIFLQTVIMYVH